MLESTKALIEISKSGAASPPIPSAAVECMTWCVAEIRRLRAALVAASGEPHDCPRCYDTGRLIYGDKCPDCATVTTSASQ